MTGSAPDCWLGLWLLSVCCILQLLLTWGVIVAWFRARLQIKQTTHAHVKLVRYSSLYQITFNGQSQSQSKSQGQSPSQWWGEVYTHGVQPQESCFKMWRERKNCEQPILSAKWHMFGNILYCFEYFIYQIQNVLWEI